MTTFDEGYEAYYQDVSKRNCPHTGKDADFWLEGWELAEEEFCSAMSECVYG